MQLILITGIDGAGKSTFLNRFEAASKGEKVEILRVPKIDLLKFKSNKELYLQCEFVNFLGEKADQEGNPSLKIIALFSAMLLFESLHEELSQKHSIVICERHPLIDTLVYAQVYLKVMDPNLLDLIIAKEIERQFENELNGILKRLPYPIEKTKNGMCFDLLNFLFDWFSVSSNNTIEELKKLFAIPLPDNIYFLDAPAEILDERLRNRETREFHETQKLFEKMRPLYLSLLTDISINSKIIDTSDWSNLDQYFEEIQRQINDNS